LIANIGGEVLQSAGQEANVPLWCTNHNTDTIIMTACTASKNCSLKG